ncbi:MAG: glycosyltransferase family 4 protein [Ignavibacteria bacterium]|nr:glycosyltransferase family 4 protein [Ignavibacteria bacterium]
MKILQISPQFPYPLDSGGKIGIYNITRTLSSFGAKVTLVAFSSKEIPNEHIAHFEEFCTLRLLRHSTSNTLPRIIKFFLLNKPILTEKFFTRKSRNFFLELLPELDFDIVHLDHTSLYSLGKWVQDLTKKPFGLRLHNIEWIIWKRYLDEQIKYSPQWIFLNQQTKLLKEKEKEAIESAQVVFSCTDEDRNRAMELAKKSNIVTVSPGIDLNKWKPDRTAKRNPKEIVFATTFGWVHNLNGLRWFLEKVFPIVRKEVPDVVLTIIGKDAPNSLKNFTNVSLVGYVDSVQPYYNRANLAISPLFVGSGIRVKILEAMAMELPVVSTIVGKEGITATEENGLFASDNPEEFATYVVQLIKNYDYARYKGEQARKYISENHSVENNIKIIFLEYKKILDKQIHQSPKPFFP